MPYLPLLLGLVALIAGAEGLVRGAGRLALATGLSPLVVGLTVVALGTSAPEIAVGLGAVDRHAPGIAVGNVIGSNIANVLLALGLSALLAPLAASRQLILADVPLMVAASVGVMLLARDGSFGRAEGLALTALAVAYLVLRVHVARRVGAHAPTRPVPDAQPAPRKGAWLTNLGLVAGGLVLLVLGARLLVDAAIDAARILGFDELVIGLTVVAVGTSLPEIATSAVAALRGQRDLAAGNVVGSNILNLSAVLGLAAVAAPGGIRVDPGALHFDLPVMVATALACLPIFLTGQRMGRAEGFLFLAYYAAYAAYLLLDAAGHAALPTYGRAMLHLVMPLTVLTLAVLVIRALRGNTRSPR